MQYDEAGLPTDFHLSASSPLIDQGTASALDPDGSRADVGLYGGLKDRSLDMDGDGLPAWFWPGSWTDAPEGFASEDYDCQDIPYMTGGCH